MRSRQNRFDKVVASREHESAKRPRDERDRRVNEVADGEGDQRQLGLLPGNLVFVYAGTQLPTLEQFAEQGVEGVVSLELIVAMVVMAVFPLIARWLIRRVWRKTHNGEAMVEA